MISRHNSTRYGFQQMWGLITGDLPGLIDGLLILVAYLLYPIVVVVFGFFYIFYGSILYIFGPIVIALMPLGGANRLAKSYVENIFIWNAWPILYGGFGALFSAVQMGQLGQMLSQNNFLGGLGQPRRLISDRHREHRLLAGDRRHSFHCQAHCQRRCGQHRSRDGWYGGYCTDRGRSWDRGSGGRCGGSASGVCRRNFCGSIL